jgi:hypothetical protein
MGFNFPNFFTQEVEEKYLRQIQADHAIFSSQLKLLENIVASIHAQEIHKNVNHIAAVQTKVEWLEVFFISFYAAEFTHILVELSHQPKPSEIGAVVGAAFLSGIIALISLHLWPHLKSWAKFIIITLISVLGLSLLMIFLEKVEFWQWF